MSHLTVVSQVFRRTAVSKGLVLAWAPRAFKLGNEALGKTGFSVGGGFGTAAGGEPSQTPGPRATSRNAGKDKTGREQKEKKEPPHSSSQPKGQSSKERGRLSVIRTSISPLVSYFKARRGFKPNASQSPISELKRLCALKPYQSREAKEMLFEEFSLAMTREFGVKYEWPEEDGADVRANLLFAADHPILTAFFESFRETGFVFNANQDVPAEFRRLCLHLKLKKGDAKRDKLDKRYEQAMDEDFAHMFGKNFNDIRAWQRIFKRLGVNPIPSTVKEAKKAARKIHVNIVELMATQRIPDGMVRTFETESALAGYTQEEELFYPKKWVGKGGMLEFFLRRVAS